MDEKTRDRVATVLAVLWCSAIVMALVGIWIHVLLLVALITFAVPTGMAVMFDRYVYLPHIQRKIDKLEEEEREQKRMNTLLN